MKKKMTKTDIHHFLFFKYTIIWNSANLWKFKIFYFLKISVCSLNDHSIDVLLHVTDAIVSSSFSTLSILHQSMHITINENEILIKQFANSLSVIANFRRYCGNFEFLSLKIKLKDKLNF